MATATTTPPGPPGMPEGVPYLLSVADFDRMIDAGIIPPDRRVGLWGGRIYEKMAKTLPHAIAASKLLVALGPLVPAGWFFWPENPITIADDKAPLPDLALVRGRPDDYRDRRSGAADVGLLIEIADTSLRKDTGEALVGYARAGIATYWVMNLVVGRVEVYTVPAVREGGPCYESMVTYAPGQDVPLLLDGREVARIPADEILPA